MGHTRYEPTFDNRPAWNAGRMVGAKKPLKPRDVWAIRFFLEHEGRLRDRAMFDLAIDSKLRGCDVVKIAIGDLVSNGSIRNRATIIQQMTGRPVQFELLEPTRTCLPSWLERRGVHFVGHRQRLQTRRGVAEMKPCARCFNRAAFCWQNQPACIITG